MNEYLYGSIGGLTGTIFSHPFDTIRIRSQLKLPLQFSYKSYQQQKPIHNYVSYLFKKLYCGIKSPLIGIGLEKTIIFGVYNQLNKKYDNPYIASYIAGLSSCFIVTPVEKIKIHFQSSNNSKLEFKTLYRGFLPTLFREPPGYLIYFYSYNLLSNIHQKKIGNINYLNIMMYGGLSGCASWLFIYPFDHIKTIKQELNYSFKDIHKFIIKKPYKYYNGFSLAILRAFPLHAGVFLGYELSKKYIG
jgi:solute carrier family 25 (mitochondrial carnitine/acylcarnitine transporter), member 20/29